MPPDTAQLPDGRPVPQPVQGHRSATTPPQRAMIGRQAMEIINGVLAKDSECDDAIRQALRRQVAACPGHPELALLEHVLAVRGGTALPISRLRSSVSGPKCGPRPR